MGPQLALFLIRGFNQPTPKILIGKDIEGRTNHCHLNTIVISSSYFHILISYSLPLCFNEFLQ
jgi:hypothetical protein